MTRNNIKGKVIMLALVGTLICTPVSAFAASVGGGIWDYGTKIAGINKKNVYSNYYHPSKKHKSSCSIGTTSASSGWFPKGTTSYASAMGTWGAETHAYYDYR